MEKKYMENNFIGKKQHTTNRTDIESDCLHQENGTK
jgi:hypothetical protein